MHGIIKECVLSAIRLDNICIFYSDCLFSFIVVLWFVVQHVYRRFYIIYSGLF